MSCVSQNTSLSFLTCSQMELIFCFCHSTCFYFYLCMKACTKNHSVHRSTRSCIDFIQPHTWFCSKGALAIPLHATLYSFRFLKWFLDTKCEDDHFLLDCRVSKYCHSNRRIMDFSQIPASIITN